jgi:hypothetical protein
MALSRDSANAAATPSPRAGLARLALGAALTVEGVVRGDAGPLGICATVDGQERLDGIIVAASADGRYSVALLLIARLVPLEALAERVRERVSESTRTAGLGELLGSVDITFEDVAEPSEAAG